MGGVIEVVAIAAYAALIVWQIQRRRWWWVAIDVTLLALILAAR